MDILSTEQIDELRALSYDMISSLGSDIIIINSVDSYVNGVISEVETPINYKADISSYESNEVNENILATDLKLMIPNDNSIVITNDSKISIGGVEFDVVRVIPEKKKNIIVYYMVQARK